MNHQLSITLQIPSSSARAALILEQKGDAPLTGTVSAANMVRFLGRMLYGSDTENDWQETADCGMDGTNMVSGVYAYPSPAELAYQIETTHGTLSERVIEEVEHTEVIALSMDDEAQTKYPVLEIVSVEAQGDLFDGYGGIIPLPAITWTGDRIRLSRPVYGSIRVVYRMLRHAYDLTVPRRDPMTTTENFYSSVVYAWWKGDGTWLEIEPPPGAEEFAADEGCGWGSGSINDPEEDPPTRPQAAGADRSIVIDYCTNEVISDSTYEK